MRICIIGGGMAGMICAITASFNSDNKITLYERQSAIGKKVAITGNGRCNLSNVDVKNTIRYSSQNFERLYELMASFDNDRCQEFYKENGLVTTVDKGGIYPVSGQALSVVKILESRMLELGVNIVCDKYIDSIEKKGDSYIVDNKQYDAVVLAFGGKAGIYGENALCGIEIIKSLELKGVRPAPALTGVICKCDNKSINGVRIHAKVSLYDRDEFIASDEGNLQISENGLSGIPVFNLTNHMPYGIGPDNDISFVVDYMPEMTEQDMLDYFCQYKEKRNTSASNMLLSMFNDKMSLYLLEASHIKGDSCVRSLSKENIIELINNIKAYKYKFDSLRNYKNAQVMKGGVDLSEIDENYMLKKHSGIYAIGEMIDVSGECGGYNLYFAYHSGRAVGDLLSQNTKVKN